MRGSNLDLALQDFFAENFSKQYVGISSVYKLTQVPPLFRPCPHQNQIPLQLSQHSSLSLILPYSSTINHHPKTLIKMKNDHLMKMMKMKEERGVEPFVYFIYSQANFSFLLSFDVFSYQSLVCFPLISWIL